MPIPPGKLVIATRGSALALVQANSVADQCRRARPDLQVELAIIKTTGDKLQTASLAREGRDLPKGLFTKELEIALLEGRANLAVHSLKDLPTELPPGLILGGVSAREDVRDVFICRDASCSRLAAKGGRAFAPGISIPELPAGTVVASSSTRRKAQLHHLNPNLVTPDIRGNVLTRLEKLANHDDIDGTILALAGLSRLNYRITNEGHLAGEGVPEGILAIIMDVEAMLPCVGQGALGIEISASDPFAREVANQLNCEATFACVSAERAFLAEMGGGCQSPVAAYATNQGKVLRMRAACFTSGPMRQGELTGEVEEAVSLGRRLAKQLTT